MALSKREQVLIERYKKSGRVVDQEKLDAPFGLLIRPLAMVGLDAGKFALWFEDEISALLKITGLTLPVRHIMISPHLIDQTVSQRPVEGIAFKQRESAVFVAIDIDHSTWLLSSDKSKLALMYENVRQSILAIPQKYVGDSGREALLDIVESSYTKLKTRLMH